MKWIHNLRRRLPWRTESWLLAAMPGDTLSPAPSFTEQRAYLLAGVIGRAPHKLMPGLEGPSTEPVRINAFAPPAGHCDCWPDTACCTCAEGTCPTWATPRRQPRERANIPKWTGPSGPPSERPSIHPFPSRRGTW